MSEILLRQLGISGQMGKVVKGAGGIGKGLEEITGGGRGTFCLFCEVEFQGIPNVWCWKDWEMSN